MRWVVVCPHHRGQDAWGTFMPTFPPSPVGTCVPELVGEGPNAA